MSYHHDMIYDDTLGVCVCVRESRSSDGFRRLPEKGERPEEGRDKVAEKARDCTCVL